MTQELSNREKYKGVDVEGAVFEVYRNNDVINRAAGAHIYSDKYSVIGIDQIDAVIQALKEVKEDYESINEEAEATLIGDYLLTQPRGTKFRHKGSGNDKKDDPILIGQGEYVYNGEIALLSELYKIKKSEYEIIAPGK